MLEAGADMHPSNYIYGVDGIGNKIQDRRRKDKTDRAKAHEQQHKIQAW